MIKISLTRKLIVVFSGILVAVTALNIVLNCILLPKVYTRNKFEAMEKLYNSLYAEYERDSDIDTIISILKDSLDNENFRVYVWDKDNKLIIDSLPLSHYEEFSNAEPKEQPTQADYKNRKFDNFYVPKRDFHFGRNEAFLFFSKIDDDNVIYECDNYVIFAFTSFENYEEKNLYLKGYFPDEYKVLIQLPYASVDEAIAISNTLLFIVGIAMLIVGLIIVTITSRTIARPVKELSHIAKSMENLDFSKKYSSKRKDEIGSLGESINSLSTKLESTINELYEKNERLQQDIELKSRVDRMRKEFIANASHELKTPVAVISGYAEGLRDNIAVSDESRILYTDVIIEEAEKMDHIIRQMLDLMELDSTEEIVSGQSVSITDAVNEALASYDLIFKQNNISLTCDLDEDCIVRGDYFRLHQAVINYISNAVNHVDDNRIIRVSVKKTDDKVTFLVYNSGASIPTDDKTNIWERFYKVDKAHTREYGGTGLGLSIVRSIIELHGGEYGFNNLSDGVEFYFILDREAKTYET